MKVIVNLILIFGLLHLCSSCGSDAATNADAESESISINGKEVNASEAMSQLEEALSENGLDNGEVVNFRVLQDHLGTEMGNMKRTAKSGQTTGFLTVKISTAEATYENENGGKMDVSLVDTGGFGMALAGMAAWSNLDVDREDENGTERTGTFKGHKSYEKERKADHSSELALIIHNRFILTADGVGCTLDELKSALGSIDFGDLPKGKE